MISETGIKLMTLIICTGNVLTVLFLKVRKRSLDVKLHDDFILKAEYIDTEI